MVNKIPGKVLSESMVGTYSDIIQNCMELSTEVGGNVSGVGITVWNNIETGIYFREIIIKLFAWIVWSDITEDTASEEMI